MKVYIVFRRAEDPYSYGVPLACFADEESAKKYVLAGDDPWLYVVPMDVQ